MLGIACAQTAPPNVTNSIATNKPRSLTDAEIGLVPETTNPVTNADFIPDDPIEILRAKAKKEPRTLTN